MERRLPIYLLLDCSESMIGEPLTWLAQGLEQLRFDLRTHPIAVETAWVSVIVFAHSAKQIVPLTEVLSFNPPALTVGPGTSLGAALDLLSTCIERDVRVSTPTQKGDWKPVAFLLTDGEPTDRWREAVDRFKSRTLNRLAALVAIGCGASAGLEVLREITPTVLHMPEVTIRQMQKFFKAVSGTVTTVSVDPAGSAKGLDLRSVVGEGIVFADRHSAPALPKPPTQIILAARCRVDGQGYLMRYRLPKEGDVYEAEGAYRVGPDYFKEADPSSGITIAADKLRGGPACPYCGRRGWAVSRTGLVCNDEIILPRTRAQVLFVLDVTGSMHDEIAGVKASINSFVDHIQSHGLSVEVGLIAFRDLEMDEPPEVFDFDGRPFTADVEAFKRNVTGLTADGGGNNVGESSFDALVRACRLPFDPTAEKILILVTDEPPLLPDAGVRTVEDVLGAVRRANINQLHVVVSPGLGPRYAVLHSAAKGEMFSLDRGGVAFESVLMDVGKAITVATRLA